MNPQERIELLKRQVDELTACIEHLGYDLKDATVKWALKMRLDTLHQLRQQERWYDKQDTGVDELEAFLSNR